MTITESIDQESRRKTKKSALKKKSTVVVVDVHQHRRDNSTTTTTTIRGGRITVGGRHPQQQQQQEEDTSATSRPPTSPPPPPLSSSYDDLRRQHWKESKYAVGLVNITWSDSRQRATTCSGIWWQSCICSVLNAGRVGNMAVLLQKQQDDGAFVCIVGPHWPFFVFVTIPMIVIVSGVTVWKGMLSMPWWFILVWSLLSLGLLLVLCMVSCRDPGILKRYSEIPANVVTSSDDNEQEWTWNDQARTFRPPKAKYDADCAVVVEEFDHTCPWTGTAIGKRNMPWFRVFCGMVLFVLVVDIVILVGPF